MFAADMKTQLLSENYEHPFKWDPTNTMKATRGPNDILDRLSDKLCDTAANDDIQFEYLMYYIGQSYAYASIDKLQEALGSLQRGEDKLKEYIDDSPDDTVYGQILFLHLITSMRAYLLMLKNDVNATFEVFTKIPSIIEMDPENMAALEGSRGLFFAEYGLEGFRMAVEFFSKAIEIDPEESSWHFLKGKYLGRLRRIERPLDMLGEQEISHFERAATLKKNGTYSLFLAEMYREMSKCYFKLLRNSSGFSKEHVAKEKKKAFELNEKSLKLYNESLELKPECPQTLFRCAKGFMQLPLPFRQVNRAKELLEKGLKLIPNDPYGNHAMAQYYQRIEKDTEKAIKYLKICEERKVFPATMDLVRIENQTCEALDTVRRLEALLNDYKETIQKCQILGLLSSYHLLSLNDLRKACDYANQIKHLNGNYDFLTNHLPLLPLPGKAALNSGSINLREMLMDEIKITVQEPTCSSNDREYFETLFQDLSSSSDQTVSITDAPRNLKSKFVANLASTVNENRNKDAGERVSKFKFSGPNDRKWKGATSMSAKTSSYTIRKDDDGRSRKFKGEDETNCGGSQEKNDDNGVDEIDKSMLNMKVGDSRSSGEDARSRKSRINKAVMSKYLD